MKERTAALLSEENRAQKIEDSKRENLARILDSFKELTDSGGSWYEFEVTHPEVAYSRENYQVRCWLAGELRELGYEARARWFAAKVYVAWGRSKHWFRRFAWGCVWITLLSVLAGLLVGWLTGGVSAYLWPVPKETL